MYSYYHFCLNAGNTKHKKQNVNIKNVNAQRLIKVINTFSKHAADILLFGSSKVFLEVVRLFTVW